MPNYEEVLNTPIKEIANILESTEAGTICDTDDKIGIIMYKKTFLNPAGKLIASLMYFYGRDFEDILEEDPKILSLESCVVNLSKSAAAGLILRI